MFTTQDIARLAFLRKHVGMLTAAQGHLRGIPARHNALRLSEARAEIESLETLAALVARDGGSYTDDGEFVAAA